MQSHGPHDRHQPPSDYNPDRRLFGRGGQASGEWEGIGASPAQGNSKLPVLPFMIALLAAAIIGLSAGYYLGTVAAPDSARGKPGPTPHYVRMDPINLPMTDSDGSLVGATMLTILIEVPDPSAAERVRNLAPRLRDKMMTELSARASAGEAISTSSEGLKEARDQITAMARQIIGAKYVTQALIVNALGCPPSLGQPGATGGRRGAPNW